MTTDAAESEPSPTDDTRGALWRALRYRNFQLYLAGQVVSLVGSWMQNVAQSWLVYRLTGSELLLGLTAFCAHAPAFLLGPIAGVVADRYDRRRVVLVTQTLFLLQAITLAALTWSGRITVPHILVLAAIMGSINSFDVTARQSLMIHMTAKEDVLGAVSLNSIVFNAARIAGPSIGGFVVAAFGEAICFTLNAASFLALIAGFLLMRLPEIEPRGDSHPWTDLKEGLAYAWNHKQVRTLLIVCGLATATIAPLIALGPIFADRLFHRGSAGLGVMLGSLGLGAVAGTITLASRRTNTGLPGVVLMSSLTMGLALLCVAWAPNYYLLLAAMAITGFSIFRQNAAVNTLVQTSIEERFRGRVMALYSMMAVGMLPAGSLFAGLAAPHIGPRWTVTISAIACLLVGLFFNSQRTD